MKHQNLHKQTEPGLFSMAVSLEVIPVRRSRYFVIMVSASFDRLEDEMRIGK
jgi:hypothetical protein